MPTTDDLALHGYHHIELAVGNAKQAMHYYRTVFGFTPVAYAGPETGVRDRASWVLEQGRIRLVVSAGLSPDHELVRHQATHGDGVIDVAFSVPDIDTAFAAAVARGARPAEEPRVLTDDHGKVVIAAIHAYGETLHRLIDSSAYDGPFLPGYRPVATPQRPTAVEPVHELPEPGSVGVGDIDHVVANVERGQMEAWASFYERIMGFAQLVHFDDQAISTEYTALMSKVLWDGEGRVKLPINEPAEGAKKSQIEEFLEYYGGPGVQHMALATDDIVATVAALRDRGARLMRVPDSYYEDVAARLDWSEIGEDLERLRAHGILVDQDDEGYLLQLFTEPVGDRPTLFYEIIERHGSRGFGLGNFKALFEAIEREQAARGNL